MLPAWSVEQMEARFPLGTEVMACADPAGQASTQEPFRVIGYTEPLKVQTQRGATVTVSGMLEVQRVTPLEGVLREATFLHPELHQDAP